MSRVTDEPWSSSRPKVWLRVGVEHATGYTLVTVAGEVDFSNSDQFAESLLNAAFTLREPHLIVDISGIEFFDSSGLRALVVVWKAMHASQGAAIVACPSIACLRFFRRTGLDRYLHIRPTVPEAVAEITSD